MEAKCPNTRKAKPKKRNINLFTTLCAIAYTKQIKSNVILLDRCRIARAVMVWWHRWWWWCWCDLAPFYLILRVNKQFRLIIYLNNKSLNTGYIICSCFFVPYSFQGVIANYGTFLNWIWKLKILRCSKIFLNTFFF